MASALNRDWPENPPPHTHTLAGLLSQINTPKERKEKERREERKEGKRKKEKEKREEGEEEE